jgi:hypothetical protein
VIALAALSLPSAPRVPSPAAHVRAPRQGARKGRPYTGSSVSLAGAIRSSTKLFHSWQCGHCQSSSVLR